MVDRQQASVSVGVRSDLKNEQRIARDFDRLFKSVERTTKAQTNLNRATKLASNTWRTHRNMITGATANYRALNTQLTKTAANLALLGKRRQGLESTASGLARIKIEANQAANATNRLNRSLARSAVISANPVAAPTTRGGSGAALGSAVAASAVSGANSAAGIARQAASVSRLDAAQRLAARSAFNLSGAFTILTSSLAIFAFVRAADEVISLENRLRVITDNTEDFNSALADVKRIASSSQSAIRTTASTYARFQLASEKLGTTQRQIAAAVEATNLSFLVSGSTAREAEAATVQLAQGLSSGKFSGDELRSVLENNILLARDLADALGTNVGFLRDLAAEGALNQSVVLNTLISQLSEYRRRAEDIDLTFGRAFTQVNNAFVEYLNETEEANDATRVMIDGLLLLRDNMDVVIPSVVGVVGIYLAYKSAATAAAVITGTLSASFAAATAASRVYSVAIAGATIATRGFTAALIANPFTAILVGLGAIAGAYYTISSGADAAALSVSKAEQRLANAYSQVRRSSDIKRGSGFVNSELGLGDESGIGVRDRGAIANRIAGTARRIKFDELNDYLAPRYLDQKQGDVAAVGDAARSINIPALVTRVRRQTDSELVKLQREQADIDNALLRLRGTNDSNGELSVARAAVEQRSTRPRRDNLERLLGFEESLEAARNANAIAQRQEQEINRTELLPINQQLAQAGRSRVSELDAQLTLANDPGSRLGQTYGSNTGDIERGREALQLERDTLLAQQRSLRIEKESSAVQDRIVAGLTERQQIEQEIIALRQLIANAESAESKATLTEQLDVLSLKAKQASDVLPELASVFDNLRSDADQFGDAAGRAFTSFALGARSASDAAKALLEDIINLAAQRLITEPIANVVSLGITQGFSAAFGVGAGTSTGGQGRDISAGGGSGFLPSSTRGAATGISGRFGGNSGTDNNLLSFNGRPFLRVSQNEGFNVIPQGQNGGASGGGNTVIVEAPVYLNIGLGLQQGIRAEIENLGNQLPGLITAHVSDAFAKRQISA